MLSVSIRNLVRRKVLEEVKKAWASSLARNAGWLFLGRGLSILCQGIYFVLLARLLGSTEYGIYAGVVAMVSIVSLYAPLGSHLVFLRYVSRDPGDFALYWGNILVTTLVLGGLLTAGLTWAGPHVAHAYSWTLVLFIALGDCICAQLTLAAGNVFLTFEKMRLSASLNLLVNLLRVVAAGSMFWRLHSATAWQWAVAALLVSMVATAISLIVVTVSFGRPAFSSRLLRDRSGEGSIFALSYSTGSIYDNIDKTMMGHYGMNAANGIYTMAYRVIDVACVPFGSIQLAASPRLFRKGVEGVHSTAAYAARIVKRTGPAALVTTLILWVTASVIPYLAGSSFSESVSALRWLCLLPVFRCLHWSAGDALTGTGHQKLRLGTHSVAAAFNFGINCYLIPHFGWKGAAWASLATDGLLAVLNWAVLSALQLRTTSPIQQVS